WITGTVTDESTRLPGFSHDHVAAAEAFIQSKKLCRVIRLTGCYRKDGQVTAANRAEQRIAVCWWYFTRLQRARNNNRGYHYQNNSKNRKAGANRQPHSRASPVLRSYFPPVLLPVLQTRVQTQMLPRTRDPLRTPPPPGASPVRPRHTKDRACRGTDSRVFQEVFFRSLKTERTISSSLRLNNC